MARTSKNTNTTVKADVAVSKTEKAAETKSVEVKAAPAEAPKAEAKKPAAKKTVAKKASAKKTAPAKKTAAAKKTAPAKKAAEKAVAAAPKRRGGRKPKSVTIDDIVAKINKRIDKSAAKSIAAQGKAAVDIKVYGAFEAHMYIEIKDGAVTVAPYDYIEKDIEAAISVESAIAIADGKLTVKEAVENGSLYVFGNVQFALIFAKLFN